MNLDHLRYFETIARLEHYGRAAEALHISQPALSYAMEHLESELGVALFTRRGRNVQLTRYGQYFLRAITGSLLQLDTGIRAMQEFGQEGGIILVGGIRKLASRYIPRLMQQFLKEDNVGTVHFSLHTESSFSADLLKDVENGSMDMAFVSQPGDAASFECIPFPTVPFVLIAAPDHPLLSCREARGETNITGYPQTELARDPATIQKSSPLRDCLSYPFVLFSERSALRASVDSLFAQINAVPLIACETEEDDVIAGMVESGFGLGILPDYPNLRSYRLSILSLTDVDCSRTAYLCRKRLPEYPAAADRFFRFCREKLTELT